MKHRRFPILCCLWLTLGLATAVLWFRSHRSVDRIPLFPLGDVVLTLWSHNGAFEFREWAFWEPHEGPEVAFSYHYGLRYWQLALLEMLGMMLILNRWRLALKRNRGELNQ